MSQVYPSNIGYAPPQAYSTGYPVYQQGYPAQYGQQVYTPQVQVPMGQYVPYGYSHNPYSIGARVRQFFGFAPAHGVRYQRDRGTWGFMGYSRRQRYIDPRTGGEVDRQGRPVYRI